MKKLTLQEIKDTLVGCTILGTGGGGSLESGLEAVEKAWNAGHEFKLLSFDEINDDSYYANPYYCRSWPVGWPSQRISRNCEREYQRLLVFQYRLLHMVC